MSETCAPIDTLEELNNYIKNPPRWGKSTVSISRRSKSVRNQDLYYDGHTCHLSSTTIEPPYRFEYGTLPKTLVCHDMKNGYHDDKFVDGSDNSSAYAFYHWSSIDIFVYFSHHFITIPPLGWINVAHKHGVKILGTIITEWNAGVKICDEFLKSDDEMNKFIRNLVGLTKYLKMDGWLLNIENEVKQVGRLIQFVKLFTDELHKEIPDSLVIWYDSVINTGSLEWQNALNHINKDFFDVCDGIFTNYCWGKYHLENSVSYAKSRRHDVYVGVDVWGRNFWGGGCFNTAEAVKEIYEFNLSMAIFAPAWTHEAIKSDDVFNHQKELKRLPDNLSCIEKFTNEIDRNQSLFIQCAMKDYFILRENALWCTLRPYLNTRGPTELPFHTFFCLGSGEKRRIAGKVIKNETWFNLREQQYQPTNTSCSLSYILTHIPDKPRDEKFKPNDNLNVKSEDEINQIDTATVIIKANPESTPNQNFNETNSTCLPIACTEITEDATQSIVNTIDAAPKNNNKRPPIKKFDLKICGEEAGCFSYYLEDSYYGGNCVKISPVKSNVQPITRLFQCEFHCDNNFIIYYIAKPLYDDQDQDLHILLTLKNNKTKKITRLTLCEEELRPSDNNYTIVLPSNNNSLEFEQLKKNIKMYYPGFYEDVDNDAGWAIRYYYVKFPNSTIYNIDCRLYENTGSMLLGGLGVVKDVLLF